MRWNPRKTSYLLFLVLPLAVLFGSEAYPRYTITTITPGQSAPSILLENGPYPARWRGNVHTIFQFLP